MLALCEMSRTCVSKRMMKTLTKIDGPIKKKLQKAEIILVCSIFLANIVNTYHGETLGKLGEQNMLILACG